MNGMIYVITDSNNDIARDIETGEELIFNFETDAWDHMHRMEDLDQDYTNEFAVVKIDLEDTAKALFDGGWRAEDKGDLIAEHGHIIGIILTNLLSEIEEEVA